MNPLQFYKCLADDTRLRCLMLIDSERELCVCELTTAVQDSQPKISRHLAQLRQCGLLLDRRQGKWVYYRINPLLPAWAKTVLKKTTEHNSAFLETNLDNLRNMGERPERARICA